MVDYVNNFRMREQSHQHFGTSQILGAGPPPLLHNPLVTLTTLPPIVMQQNYEMERLRITGIVNQEVHAVWPYGPTTFYPPMYPPHNMPVPCGIGHVQYPVPPYYAQQSPSALHLQAAQQHGMNYACVTSANSTAMASLVTNTPTTTSNNYAPGHVAPTPPPMHGQDTGKVNIQAGGQCANEPIPSPLPLMPSTYYNDMLMNANSAMSTSSPPMPNMQNYNSINPKCPGNKLAYYANANAGFKDSSLIPDYSNVISDCASPDQEFYINTPMPPQNYSISKLDTVDRFASPGDARTTVDTGTITSPPTDTGADGDSSRAAFEGLTQAQYDNFVNLALQGSSSAEVIAQNYKKSPCFKKIDSLCRRLKQDIVRECGLLANINSQGIAFAVKEIIFVFTRIVGAWTTLRGYIYNTPEGLNKVKNALHPDFMEKFSIWQDITTDFVDILVKSFKRLDQLAQGQKKVPPPDATNNGTPKKMPKSLDFDVSLDQQADIAKQMQPAGTKISKKYQYTMVEDSENTQLEATASGTYLKTGTYEPIKKDPTNKTPEKENKTSSPRNTTTNKSQAGTDEDPIEDDLSDVESSDSEATVIPARRGSDPTQIDYDTKILSDYLREHFDNLNAQSQSLQIGKENVEKLNMLLDRLMNMQHAQYFFKMQFIKNYFPEFLAKHKSDIHDVRSIILKTQIGGYHNVYEVVHDLRKIIFCGRQYLRIVLDGELMKAIDDYDLEIYHILSKPPFGYTTFDHIKGNPNEKISPEDK